MIAFTAREFTLQLVSLV